MNPYLAKSNIQKKGIHKNIPHTYYENYLVDCITEKKIINYPLVINGAKNINYLYTDTHLKENPTKRRKSFENIYKNKIWGNQFDKDTVNISASGEGSTLQYTQEIIAILHYLVIKIKENKPENYQVKLLDAPCGDFVWMRRFLETRNDVEYTGVDIVEDLIQRHKTNNKNKQWTFIKMDLSIQKNLTSFDIILSRMMFQHLIFSDVLNILKLFSNSGSSYFVTTTYPYTFFNKEISLNPHRYSRLNLMNEPFCLEPPLCLSRDGDLSNPHSSYTFLGVWKFPLKFLTRESAGKSLLDIKSSPFAACYVF